MSVVMGSDGRFIQINLTAVRVTTVDPLSTTNLKTPTWFHIKMPEFPLFILVYCVATLQAQFRVFKPASWATLFAICALRLVGLQEIYRQMLGTFIQGLTPRHPMKMLGRPFFDIFSQQLQASLLNVQTGGKFSVVYTTSHLKSTTLRRHLGMLSPAQSE